MRSPTTFAMLPTGSTGVHNQLMPIVLGLALCMMTLVGCTSYHAQPLPAAKDVLHLTEPGLERLQLDAAQLEHPLLAPLELDLSNGLSPDEAAVLAVLANPDLVAIRDRHGEAAAQLVGAGLMPNPDFSAEVARPHGSGSTGTVDATNLGLAFDVNSLVGRAGRVAAASNELHAVDLGIAWQEWQVAQAARLAVVRIVMLARRLALIRAESSFEAETVSVLRAAMDDGDATIQDLGIHRSALEVLRQLEGDLNLSEMETRSELNQLLGMPPGFKFEVVLPDNSQALGALASPVELVNRALAGRLDLRALEYGYQSQEALVHQAVLAQFPSLSLGITKQRNESALKFLGGFVSLGLPLFDRNQGGIALERATRTRLGHEYEARIATVRAEVTRFATADSLLAEQILIAHNGILSLVDVEAAEHTGVLHGDVDRLAWQDARSTLLDMRLKLAALDQARLEVRVALQTALGSGRISGTDTAAPSEPAALKSRKDASEYESR